MICPYCGINDDKVIDSRSSEGGAVIRRRRQCLGCDRRFTTYERVEQTARLVVIKRDGTRVPFNRENILKGVLIACGKRRISEEAKARLVDEVEEELHREFDREVESRVIGERVMRKLRDLDEVAYIRFASEYLKLGSAGELLAEIHELNQRPKNIKDQRSLFERAQPDKSETSR
ncbi:MAG: transcriptional regulator NrdR [Phycisphaerales bacterium]